MKHLKVTPHELDYERSEQILKLTRLWPKNERSIVHEILKHVQFLNCKIRELEDELRTLRQTEIFETEKKLQTRFTPQSTVSKSLEHTKTKVYVSRVDRYRALLSGPKEALDTYLRINTSVTIEDMRKIIGEI